MISLRTIILYAVLLQVLFFPFIPIATILGYGLVNSTFLIAIIPLAVFATYIFIIAWALLCRRLIIGRFMFADSLVAIFFALSIIQTLNPILPHFGYALKGFYEIPFWITGYILTRLLIKTEYEFMIFLKLCITVTLALAVFGEMILAFGPEQIFPKSYLETFSKSDLYMLSKRAGGFMNSPFGFSFLCSLGFGLALFLRTDTHWNWILIIITILLATGIYLGNSRSVILGTVAGICAGYLLLIYRGIRRREFFIVFSIISAAGVMLLIYLFFKPVIEPENVLLKRIVDLTSFYSEINVIARYDVWLRLLPFGLNNFLGYGTGALGSATYEYGPILDNIIVADNQYLSILIQYGFLGLILFIFILIFFLCIGVVASRLKLNYVACVLIYVVTLVAVSGIGAPPLSAFPGNLFFWLILGGGVSIVSRKQKERKRIPY